VSVVSVANPPAFAPGTRTSPVDGANLARTFPGSSVRPGDGVYLIALEDDLRWLKMD